MFQQNINQLAVMFAEQFAVSNSVAQVSGKFDGSCCLQMSVAREIFELTDEVVSIRDEIGCRALWQIWFLST